MRYPSYKEYEKIYQKYINLDNLFKMMDLVEDYKGKSFLDICCGNGAATEEALKRGASHCYMIDQEIKMIPSKFLGQDNFFSPGGIRLYIDDVESSFRMMSTVPEWRQFDIGFCRQSINYWLNNESAILLFERFKKGGIFIFNTFNSKPSGKPKIKEYSIDDINFIEISYLINDMVHHVQIREGHEPHVTKFRWIDEQEFKYLLSDYFDIEIIRKEKTDIYKCIRN